ncbi:hypothetical protein [Lactobacillus amylovorus]|uniref:hypothetical protein n=1 Tax=Lactobacillus amylovorus TaxID=1604 RepID=UPI003F8CD616
MTGVTTSISPWGHIQRTIVGDTGAVEIWGDEVGGGRGAVPCEVVIHQWGAPEVERRYEEWTLCRERRCTSHRYYDYRRGWARVDADLRALAAAWLHPRHRTRIWRDAPAHWMWRCNCGRIGRWQSTFGEALSASERHRHDMADLSTDDGLRRYLASTRRTQVAA